MAARNYLSRLTLIGVWMNILVSMECLKEFTWDGCYQKHAVTGVDLCFNLTIPVDGITAWKKCTSIELMPDFLELLKENVNFMDDLNKTMVDTGTNETTVWVGGIEAYLDAHVYVSYNDSFSTSDFSHKDSKSGRSCLALDTKGFRFIGRDCSKKMPMMCTSRKFAGVLHNAVAPEACNSPNALVLEPFNDCYKIVKNCNRSMHTILPNDKTADLTHVEMYHPFDVQIIKMKNRGMVFLRNNITYPNATDICYTAKPTSETSDRSIRLELRYNKSVNALTLWVNNPGKALWPPKCVGGRVADSAGDRTALPISLPEGKKAPPVIWCYVKNFITGSIAFSNSVMRPDRTRNETCPPIETGGFPRVASVNETASCLRCLKEALSDCPEGSKKSCTPVCGKKGCGHFRITLNEWKSDLNRSDDFKELEMCATNEACAGKAFWQLTEGEDCNGDGVNDCDDRFTRIFEGNCLNKSSIDPRGSKTGIRFWKCQTNRRRDFVDVVVENKTARYYCENDMPKEKSWASPEYFDGISPYVAIPSTTPSPLSSTIPSSVPTTATPTPMTHKQASLTLHRLTIKPNATITKEDMDAIVKNVSKLLNVGEEALLKAQIEANVSSLAKLLENILIYAPDDFNFTTDKIAVSKEKAIGFQLVLSDEPTEKDDSFGPKATQIPLRNEEDLRNFTNKIEAAVILRDLPENVTLVVVTFAKSNDFIPCRPPLKVKTYNTNGESTSNITPPSSSTEAVFQTIETTPMTTGNETIDTIHTDVSEKYCPFQKGIVIGCVNSHILQVGLLNNNGSYQRLPEGKHVDLIFRTKTNASLGQAKKCVYWDFDKKGWATHGCTLLKEEGGLDTCRCTHLTHFAQLVADGDAVVGPQAESLRLLSMYACAVSVLALCGVLSAGAFSRKWREKKENKIMLNLAVSLCMFMLLFLWSAVFTKPPLNVHRCKPPAKPTWLCQARGIALHYAVLSSFCWMLVEAHTHYMRLSSPRGIDVSRFVLKAALVGWGVPLVPVVVLMAVETDTYMGKGRDFCYPSGVAFYAATLAPICVALFVNAVIFVRILRLLFPRYFGCADAGAGPRRSGVNEWRLLCRKLLVCIAFTFLFGLTWYVGLLSFTEEAAYFFSVVVMLQGPALFVFFVLGEENVKKKLKSVIRRGVKPSDQYSSGSVSTNSKGGRLIVRPDKIPLSRSYHSSTNISPISDESPSVELRSFE